MPPFERFTVLIADAGEFTVRVTPGEEGLGLSHLSELACSQREFIEQALTQALEGGWKDCKVELPPIGRFVTVVIGGIVQYIPAQLIEDRWHWADGEGGSAPLDAVTHWRPLPSAPLSEGVR